MFRWKSPEEQTKGQYLIDKALSQLVQNTLSVVAVSALIHGGPTVMPKHAETAADYLHRKCPFVLPAQSGGSALPATFVGASEPMYSPLNPAGVPGGTVDFAMGVARAEIPIQGGGGASGGGGGASGGANKPLTTWANKEIAEYAKHHGLVFRKGAREIMVRVLTHYARCFYLDLSKSEPLTVSKIHKILKKKSYKVFV
jgi:hypothetical protein